MFKKVKIILVHNNTIIATVSSSRMYIIYNYRTRFNLHYINIAFNAVIATGNNSLPVCFNAS